jgi:hypothetical protein
VSDTPTAISNDRVVGSGVLDFSVVAQCSIAMATDVATAIAAVSVGFHVAADFVT